MRVRLLGTGTPTPSMRRMCSGYVIETGEDVIVFDHGFGAHHRLLELGIPATRSRICSSATSITIIAATIRACC